MIPAFRALAIVLALALGLAACRISVGTGGQRLQGAGITFVVPMQSSKVNYGHSGIDYRSGNLDASTDGRKLRVNGRDYGALQPGDTVDLTVPGSVKVNGDERAPE